MHLAQDEAIGLGSTAVELASIAVLVAAIITGIIALRNQRKR